MAHLLKLTQHAYERGDLTVFESVLPGTLKRIFYIANADGATRGGHRHKTAWQALVCIQGSVDVLIENRSHLTSFSLDKPDQCLVLEPDDWHVLRNFQQSAIVLVVSNEYYDPTGYITTKSTSDRKERISFSLLSDY